MSDIESLQSYAGKLSEAAHRAEAAAALQHKFVHGDEATVISTESGPLPSLAKWRQDLALIETRLANSTDPSLGVAMIGVPGTGKNLSEILADKIFPGIILEEASTSWAKISSADLSYDRADDLANFLDMHRLAKIDTQITINKRVESLKDRAEITGAPGCMLLTGPDMAANIMLRVKGAHAEVSRLRMDNPLMLKAHTGIRQTAIEVAADHVVIRENIFRRMLTSVASSAGSVYMPTYINNFAYDCLGTGKGANDDGGPGESGENRGDAFVIWGSTGKMEGNWAFCMDGQDARVAFHCEFLGQDFLTKPFDPKRDGFDYQMIGNYAYGNFRRHFAFEAVKRGLMANNTSMGGATWWCIALTGTTDCIAQDMILRYDRPATNNAGIAWSPVRGAIALGHNGRRTTLKNIHANFSDDAVGHGVVSLVTNLPMYEAVLDGVRINKPVGQGGTGFQLDKLPDAKLNNCHVQGAATGYGTYGPQDNWLKDCSAYDISGTAFSLSSGSPNSHARVDGGRVERANRAVNATNLTHLTVRGLQTKGIITADIEQFGTSGTITIDGNHNEDGNGRLSGMQPNGAFSLAQVRNIGNNPGYTYNLKYALACITDATSALNTIGKHTDKTVVASDGFAYIATGSSPTSPWAKVSTLTTPA